MHHAKNRGNKEIPFSNTIKATRTIMRNPLPELHVCREGLRMIVLVSLIVLVWGFSCFHDFSHSASRPYIPIHSIECFLHLFHILLYGLHIIE